MDFSGINQNPLEPAGILMAETHNNPLQLPQNNSQQLNSVQLEQIHIQEISAYNLDIDGNQILELQDYNLIDLYASGLDQEELDFLLNNFPNDLLGEGANRTDASSILAYLNAANISLLDIDHNNVIELQDYNLIDLYASGLDGEEFDFLLNNFSNDLLGEGANRTDASSILAHFEAIATLSQPVETLSIMPGDRLEIELKERFGEAASFNLVSEQTLPTGMLEADGTLIFTPTPSQIGTYEFSIVIQQENRETTQNFRLEVIADPIQTTRISGVIENTEQIGLEGVIVGIGEVETTTAGDGTFTLEFMGELPSDALRIEPGQEIDGLVYPSITEKLHLLLPDEPFSGVNNVISRPIYLPALDVANEVTIDPNQDTSVITATIPEASVVVKAGTLQDTEGNLYTGKMSITQVPRELTPASLPNNLLPDLVITIQPGEMVFTEPAPLSLPNRSNFANGTKMDLWSINPNTGDFEKVGVGVVNGNVIETREGGIRSSSWHFFTPELLPPIDPEDTPYNPNDKCEECKLMADAASEVEMHSGALIETHNLVSYQSLGVNRGITLTYDSLRADPRPIVHLSYGDAPFEFRGGNDFTLIAELNISRGNFEYQVPGFQGGLGLDGGEHFWRVPATGRTVDVALQADLRFQQSGLYNYEIDSGFYRFTGSSFTGSSTTSEGDFVHVNTRNSAFGAGWGIAGLQELVENPDGSILLMDGDGSEILYEAPENGGEAYVSPPGDFSVLEKQADGSFRRTMKDQMVYVFNANYQLVSVSDRNNNTTQYIYNNAGQFIKMIDPVGLETTFTYTGNRITAITDPANRVTQLQYDADGNLEKIIDPDESFRTFKYDNEHRMTGEIDQRGHEEKVVYDFAGRVQQAIRKDDFGVEDHPISITPVQVQGLYRPQQTTDPANPPVTAQLADIPEATYIDANQEITRSQIDQAGQLITATDDIGNFSIVERNDENLIVSSTDAKGNLTRFAYDDRGNLIRTEEFDTSTVVWIGTSGRWDDPNNWSTGQVPMAGDRVVIDVPGEQVITVSSNSVSLASLLSNEKLILQHGNFSISEDAVFSNGIELRGDGNGDNFTVGGNAFLMGDSEWLGFNLSGEGQIINQGDLTISSTAGKQLNTTLVNQGTINHINGAILGAFSSPTATIKNEEGAVYEFQGGALNKWASPLFENRGTILKTTDSTATLGIQLNNIGGTFDIQEGILEITFSSRFDDAVWQVAEGSQLLFAPAVNPMEHTFSGLISGGGGGRVIWDAGNNFDGGTFLFEETATFALNEIPIQWLRGTLAGDGEFINRGQFIINGSGRKTVTTTVVNEDTITQVSGVTFSTGRLKNTENAVYEIQAGTISGFSSFSFENRGTIRKTTSSTAGFGMQINNLEGTLDIQEGVLEIVGNSRFENPVWQVASGTQLSFAIGSNPSTHSLSGSITGGGGGRVIFDAGNNFNGGTFVVDGTTILDLNDSPVYWSRGTLTGEGELVNQSQIVLFSGGKSINTTLINEGTITQTSGSVGFSSTGTLENHENALLELQDGVISSSSVYSIENQGTIRKTTSAIARLGASLNNLGGTIDVQEGILQILADTRFEDAIWQVASGSQLFFPFGSNRRTHRFSGLITGGGGGLVIWDGGDNFNGGTFVADDTTILDLNDSLVQWYRGNLTGDGEFINKGRFMILGSARNQAKQITTTFVNQGTITHHSGGVSMTSPIRNSAEAVYEFQNGVLAGSSSFINSGVLRKTTDQTADVSINFNSNGTVEYEAGLLRFNRPVVNAGGTLPTGNPNVQFLSSLSNDNELPDLQINDFVVPETATAGDTVEVSWIVENLGLDNSSATAWIDAIYLSEDEILDDNDLLVALRKTEVGETPLTPGNNYSANQNVTLPDSVLGSQFLLLATDWNVRNLESDETNNLTVASIEIVAPAPQEVILEENLTPVEDNADLTASNADDDILLLANETTLNPESIILLPLTPPRIEFRVIYEYDPVFNQVTRIVDELDRETLFEIDPNNGNTLSITQVIGEVGGDDDLITRFTYTDRGLVDTITDPLLRVTDNDYNALGQLIRVTSAKGTADEAFQTFEYDDAGNLEAVTDENRNRTVYEYDDMNRITRIIEADPDGDGLLTSPITRFEYDAAGNLKRTIDARQNITENEYDKLDRLVKTIEIITGETDKVTRFEYDNIGNLTKVIDPNNNATINRYDDRDRLMETEDPEQGITKFEYDINDNLISLTDPELNTTTFEYDFRDRLIEEIDPLNKTTSYIYDAVDNLRFVTDRNSRTTQFDYDDVDRLITETWLGDGNVINYTYDKNSNLTSIEDNFSALTYTYDFRDRVKTVDNAGTPNAPNVVLTYTYDGVGNVRSLQDTINGTVSGTNRYEYDALNRMIQIEQFGNGVSDKRVDFAYNPLGQFDSINRYSDLDGNNLVVGSNYTYDQLNRLTNITHANSTETVAFYDYTYDDASRITSITDVDGVTNYSYDPRNQLTGADHSDPDNPDESYTYDANGNRIESHLHGDGYDTPEGNGNRLLSDGTYDYTYDDEGNMITQTEMATGNVREFVWDYRNRLVAIIDKDSEGNETQRVEFTYDGLGRRISKAVDVNPQDALDAVVTHFVYDGDDVLLDFVDEDGFTGGNDPVLVQRYLHGAMVDQVLAQENGEGNEYWHLSDHLGTIRDLVDETGVIANHFIYDSFGQVINESNADVETRYLYTGREFDEETGLYYYRARYYDAEIGRFISEDPIKFASSDTNIYRYVFNEPIRLNDPEGKIAPIILYLGALAAAEGISEVATDQDLIGALFGSLPNNYREGNRNRKRSQELQKLFINVLRNPCEYAPSGNVESLLFNILQELKFVDPQAYNNFSNMASDASGLTLQGGNTGM